MYTSERISLGTVASRRLEALLHGPELVFLLPATILHPFIKRNRWWNNIKRTLSVKKIVPNPDPKLNLKAELRTGGKLEVQRKCATKGIK